jgi:hypothetical protein
MYHTHQGVRGLYATMSILARCHTHQGVLYFHAICSGSCATLTRVPGAQRKPRTQCPVLSPLSLLCAKGMMNSWDLDVVFDEAVAEAAAMCKERMFTAFPPLRHFATPDCCLPTCCVHKI